MKENINKLHKADYNIDCNIIINKTRNFLK